MNFPPLFVRTSQEAARAYFYYMAVVAEGIVAFTTTGISLVDGEGRRLRTTLVECVVLVIVPVMTVLGPLMVAQYGYWIRRRGLERTTQQYLQAEAP